MKQFKIRKFAVILTLCGAISSFAQAPAKAPDFTLSDINGKSLSLSSMRGKVVVLDFWGSWCVWCIRGIPDMKKYYEKYKGKFEIIGMDCGDSLMDRFDSALFAIPTGYFYLMLFDLV